MVFNWVAWYSCFLLGMDWFYLIGIGSIDNRWWVLWVMRRVFSEGMSAGIC